MDSSNLNLPRQPIIGKRIQLRPIEYEDIQLIRSWRNRDDIRRWFINSDVISEEEQIAWWEKYKKDDADMMFMIESLPEAVPVGVVALYKIEKGEKAEFGRLMIGEESALRKGYGEEATRLTLKCARSTLKIKKVFLEVMNGNTEALSIYERCGFMRIDKNEKIVRMVLELHSNYVRNIHE
jgi:RimJ/RimL family protein N-acetyltransferase